MLRNGELKRLRPLLLFFLGYTLLFFLWVKTFWYTLTLLLGAALGLGVQPLIRFLERKARLGHALASALAAGAALAALLGLIAVAGVYAVKEIAGFLARAASGGFPEFSPPVQAFLQRAGEFLRQLDLDFLRQNQEEILAWVQGSLGLLLDFLKTLLGLLASLPTAVTWVLTTAFAAYFSARDMAKLKAWVKRLFSDSALSHGKSAWESSAGSGRKYLFSYLLLTFITFCEAFVILGIWGIPYPFLISLATAVADVLPVLGPGLVFTPLALYQLLLGEYTRALGLLIGWGVTTLIRQAIEPKLVASSVRVHPLAVLLAIYFSLVGGSLWVLVYVLGLCLLYGAFRETGALPALLPPGEPAKVPAQS